MDTTSKLEKEQKRWFKDWKKLCEAIYPTEEDGPFCRDCADSDGRCPTDNLPCDPTDRRVEIVNSLRQENQRLREVLEKQWIPVSERLPDRIGDVLIRTDAGFHHVVYFNTKKQFLYKDGKAYRVVTHWQAFQNTKGENGETTV